MTRPGLEDVQRAMHQLFREDASPDAVAARLGASPDRLRLVRRMVKGHVLRALDKCYPVVKAHLPAGAWRRLGRAYYVDTPPDDFELNRAAADFPEWLAAAVEGQRAEGAGPAHVELAHLEWEVLAAYLSPAAPKAAPGRLVVNPTVELLSLEYAVIEVLRAWDGGAKDPPPGLPEAPLEAPRLAVVWRHPTRHRVRYRWADDELLFALKVAHEELDPEAAAEAGGHAASLGRRAIAAAIRAGVLLEDGA